MKLWMRAAIFGSIFMVLFFLYRINVANSKEYIPEPRYTEPLPQVTFVNRRVVSYNNLIENLSSEIKPFKPLFFETMVLKGIMKDHSNNWIAIFSDGNKDKNNSSLLKFAAGESYDGVSMIDIDAHGCTIKYGNIERRFEVK